jgi:tRNA pseudouridine55 synthase
MSREGLLILDKPAGFTSHDAVAVTRRIADTRRVGHAGTLDPLATGVLLLCIGRATRLIEYLVGLPKTYVTTVRLGQRTATYDAESPVIEERPVNADRETIEAALDAFRGPIEQIPPMYSAIKQKGQPLYKLARRGVEVERKARRVTIHQLTVLAWEPPDVTLHVTCSSGTYIRSLGHDLGEALGCGGHLVDLRRTAVGDFTIEEAVPLKGLTPGALEEALQPADAAVAGYPAVHLDAAGADDVINGRRAPRREGDPEGELVRLYGPDGVFLGVGRPAGDAWQPHKIFPPS